MAFCPKCGTFMTDGDRFCGNCGTVVEPGQNAAPQQNVQPNFQQNVQPNFQQNVQPNYQQNYQYQQQNMQQPGYGMAYNQQYVPQGPSPFGMFMGQIGTTLLNLIKNPVETITKKLNLAAGASYIFAGMMALVLILLNFWSVVPGSSVGSSYTQGLDDLLGDLGKLAGSSYSGPSKVKFFFISFFLILIVLSALWGLFLAVGKFVFKTQITVTGYLNLVTFAAVPYTAGLFLGNILGYLHPNVGYIPYFIGLLLTIVLLYKGYESFAAPNATAVYFFPVIFFALYLVLLLYFAIVGSGYGMYYGGFKGI